MTEINVPVLRKALEHITAHPEEWDQTAWATRTACGTAYCLAGTVAVQAGAEIDWRGVSAGEESTTLANGQLIESFAAKELGFKWDFQANSLFCASNTLSDLWALANRYTEGEIEIPAELQDGS